MERLTVIAATDLHNIFTAKVFEPEVIDKETFVSVTDETNSQLNIGWCKVMWCASKGKPPDKLFIFGLLETLLSRVRAEGD